MELTETEKSSKKIVCYYQSESDDFKEKRLTILGYDFDAGMDQLALIVEAIKPLVPTFISIAVVTEIDYFERRMDGDK